MSVHDVQRPKWSKSKKRPLYIAFTVLIILSFVVSALLPGIQAKAQSQLTWTSTADFYKNKSASGINAANCQSNSYSGLAISGSAYSSANCADAGESSEITLGLNTANLSGIVSVASGASHSLALKNDGTVWAWGYNNYGQLGYNVLGGSRLVPIQVKDETGNGYLSGVTAIAAGGSHSLALKSDGTVWAWGYNVSGQLGNNIGGNQLLPTQVRDGTGNNYLTGIKAIAAGSSYSLAVKNDAASNVWAWGSNTYGQIGDSTSGTNRLIPVLVKGDGGLGELSGVRSIVAGSNHALALKNDGTVWAWGLNTSGQLGNNSNLITQNNYPIQVKDSTGNNNLTNISSIEAGTAFSIALKSDGTVWTWGNNTLYQLGNNDINGTNQFVPVQVKDSTGSAYLGSIVAVMAGNNHSIAIKSDGTLWSWGLNTAGQLGDNDTGMNKMIPVQVRDMAGTGFMNGVISTMAGASSSFAIKSDGTVWAWGNNSNGQLGDSTITTRALPINVKDAIGNGFLSGITAISTHGQYNPYYGHSLALKSNGTVWAWGYNANGQLGDNTTTQRNIPVQVKDAAGTGYLDNIIAIATGGNYSLALKNNGTVWAWGDNANGRLGDNTTTQRNLPVQVLGGLSDVTSIVAGDSHSLALKSNGTVYAWGNNPDGQVGDGTTGNSRLVPVQVLGSLSNVTSIAAGYTFSLALLSDGTVKAWGFGGYGQLGDGTGAARSTPISVKDAAGTGTLSGIVSIAGGGSHTVAVKNDGTVWAWGQGQFGQIGNSLTSGSALPVQVKDVAGTGYINGITSVGAGMSYSLAVKNDGTVWAWGDNYFGQFGDNTAYNNRLIPVPAAIGLSNAISIDAGYNQTLALKSDGTVMAWGANDYGKLGDNNPGGGSFIPVKVKDADVPDISEAITTTSTGTDHSLALKSDGTVWAWGNNNYGQLGDNSINQSSIPVQVKDTAGTGTLTGITAIAAGQYYSLALKSDGTVLAWGRNNSGQLGNNSIDQSNVPVQVKDAAGTGTLSAITAIAIGDAHSIALKSDGTVWAWGNNINGQIGDNTSGGGTNRLIPVQVKGVGGAGTLTSVIAIVAGSSHSLALKADGTVMAWGANDYGKLGDASTSQRAAPIQVKDAAGTGTLSAITSISAGGNHSLALRSDGTVWAWGYNGYGQIGDNTSGGGNDRLIPVQVKGVGGAGTLSTIAAIEAGNNHSLALKSDGTVWAWGRNNSGQLGNNLTDQSDAPIQVKDVAGTGTLSNISFISSGYNHSLAIKSDSTVLGWGSDDVGQLGDNSQVASRLIPVPVKSTYVKTVGFYEKTGVLYGMVIDVGSGKKTKPGSITWNTDALPANTSVSFEVRTGDDNKTWSAWSAPFVQSNSTNGTANLSSLPLSRYIDIKITLTTSNVLAAPKLNDFSLNYEHDITAPTNPTNAVLYNGAYSINVLDEQGNDITQSQFWNYSSPAFSFYGASDPDTVGGNAVDQLGVAGYYVYFGNDISAAYTAGTYQDHVDSGAGIYNSSDDSQTFMTPTPLSVDDDYYLRIATVDNAGNISTPVTLFTYKYDKTSPTAVAASSLNVSPFGYSAANNFTFSWTASTDLSGQGQSGVLGYQYKINDSDDNWVDSSQTIGTQVVLSGDNRVFPGRNDFYIRAIDNAGNTSEIIQTYFYYTGSAPSAPSLPTDKVVPTNSTVNSFTFNWGLPAPGSSTYTGNIIGYRYSVNSAPVEGNSTFIDIRPTKDGNGQILDVNNNGTDDYIEALLAQGITYNPDTGSVSLSGVAPATGIPAATRQGFNDFYVISVGIDGNGYNLVGYGNSNNYATILFSINSPRPGPPQDLKVFDTSNRQKQQYSVAVNWTEPTVKSVGFDGYNIERSDAAAGTDPNLSCSDDSIVYSAFTLIGASSGTSFLDTGSNNDPLTTKCYSYRVISKDDSGRFSYDISGGFDPVVVHIRPTGNYTEAPVITTDPVATAKVSTATIEWSTASDSSAATATSPGGHKANSIVEISSDMLPNGQKCSEAFGDSGNVGLNQDFENDHVVLMKGLKPDTTYHYRVKWTDEDGNVGCTTTDNIFKTQPAPRVERVTIQDIRLYTAVLTWYTSEPAISDLMYGKTTNYSNELTNVSGGATTVHTVRLEGLEHSSTYHFAVRITDIDGNEIISDDYSFDTLQYPKLSNVRFQPIADQSTATFKVTWDSNVPTTSVVEFKPEGGKQQEAVKSKLETKHEILVNGLFDNTYYLINVVGVDQYGNSVSSDINRVKTDFDTRPPIASNVAVEVSNTEFGTAAKSQVVVSWETDEPGTSQIEYDFGVTGDEFSIKSQEDAVLTTSHVVVVTGLRPSSSYHLRAISRDASGNKGISEPQSILTEQARSSILDMIINSIQSSLGWLFGMSK